MSLKATATKSRLRSYFERDSTKPKRFSKIVQDFSDVKVHNLSYHLDTLLGEGFLTRPERGTYLKNPDFKSPSDKRDIVDEHLRTNGSVVQRGAPWKPGDDAMREVLNPTVLSYLAHCFGESIVDRMKTAGFTKADLRFVETVLGRAYPLSPQQKAQCESASARSGVPTVPSSNGST